jgi:hypothetical protein
MSWEEAFGTPDGTFAETKLIGYNYLQENVRAKGKVPCGIMLAWNCVNNKGRVVAPGGYLVRIVVDNSVNKSVSTARLIVDNSAK